LQKEVIKELKKELQATIIKHKKLRALTHEMTKKCRILHNTIHELRGNIRIFCRVRPRTPEEQMKA